MGLRKRALAALVGVIAICTAVTAWPHGWPSKAVYFLRVDPAGSSVVAIRVGSNGLLEDETSSTSTGGVGLQSVNASANGLPPTAIDPLQGQDAVAVGSNYLFTVNSGSDTAVMFAIDPKDPLKLEMIGQPVPTLGEFPDAIAYSEQCGKACVINGGKVNGVTCFSVDPKQGLMPDGKGLRQTNFPSTTPPQLMGKLGSGSDIRFSPDSTKLIMSFKGKAVPPTLGHMVVFDVDSEGDVATTWTDNRVAPLSQVFGFAFDLDNPENILVSEAVFGAGLVTLDYSTDKMSLVKVINNTAFAASCWAEYSTATGSFYNINAGSPVIGQIDPESGALEGLLSFDKSLEGAEDTVFDGSLAYILSNLNKVIVYDVEKQQLLQQFEYASPMDRQFWTGMAMYPSEGRPW